jgi:thiol-disulfide isomerase/thioredoxin
LLSENPGKALELAEEIAQKTTDERDKKEWSNLVTQAKLLGDATKLVEGGKASEAKALLNQVKLPKYYTFNKELLLLKAKTEDKAGNTAAAYDSLLVAFAKSPNVALKSAIGTYGAKLGKDETQVTSDVWKKLDASAKAATPFTLKRYFTAGNTALSDYSGKVVLLTYWFPGCGPCRGEFPHFENVVKKFKGQDLEYVGINIVSDQNDYVIPFMKTSGYSFTPLEDVKGRDKGNLDNRNAAPMNFLIDQNGRLIFSNFRTDGDNEEDLELMINMLISNKKV